MNVIFYSGFSKRRNSTKRPTGGTTKSVVLKENTSLMRPAFVVSSVTWTWNYCTAWNNYYYVTDIVAEANGLFRVECELDVMATFKDSIGAYTTLISRAASDQDYDVIDSIYPAKASPTTKMTNVTNPGLFTNSRAAGCIVIGTIGQNGQRVYCMTSAQFATFCFRLFPDLTDTQGNPVNFFDFLSQEISQAVAGGLQTILQNITFLRWVPVNFSSISSLLTAVSTVYIGNWSLTTSAYELVGSTVARISSTTLSFAARDDNGARGKWLYMAPFAYYSVYIPPFGLITIDGTFLVPAGRQLTCDMLINVMTGNLTMRLYYALGNSAPRMVGCYNADIGFEMKVGGAAFNLGGVASGMAGVVQGMMNDSTAQIIGGLSSAAQSMVPGGAQVGGGVSGPAPDLTENWYAYATYFDPIDENQTELGRPLGEVKTISSLSGYVQCANAQLAIAGHEEEMTKVNGILNSGFFYE